MKGTNAIFARWEQDVALQLCSIAAQGLYFHLLRIAKQAGISSREGYLEVNGRALNSEDIARLVGEACEDVEGLLIELQQNALIVLGDDETYFLPWLTNEERGR